MEIYRLYFLNGKPIKGNWDRMIKKYNGKEKICKMCKYIIRFPLYVVGNQEGWVCFNCGNKIINK